MTLKKAVVADGVADHLQPTTSEFGYVISGLGRSGTTFLAHVFLNAGYDLGDVHPKNISSGKARGGGLELQAFAKANMRLQREIVHYWGQERNSDEPVRNERQLARRFEKIMNQRWPQVLKDPRYCDTFHIWHAAGFRPKHVFICMRPPEQRDKSIAELFKSAGPGEQLYIKGVRDSYYSYFSVFKLIAHCIEHDIPYTEVLYPRIGKDRAYAERILEPFIDNSWSAVEQTWDSSLLHHT